MKVDIEALAARVAALEGQRISSVATAADEKKDEVKVDDAKKDEEKKASGERESLAAEIQALEQRIASSMDVTSGEKKASEVDPKGVEEKITQKSLTEVEGLEHGAELATGDSVLGVAPTEFVARMKSASERLDAVANYLQATGRRAMAYRIDQIANAIDARVAKVTKPA